MTTVFKIPRSISFTVRATALALVAYIAVPTLAQNSPPVIEIASMTIPFAYEQNGDGVYNDVFNKLIDGYEGPVNVTFLPAARLDRAMQRQTTDCVYISADTDANRGDADAGYNNYKFIGPVNSVAVVVYTAAEAPDITAASQLNDLIVASDFNLVRLINSLGVKEDHKLQSQTQMIKMLTAGRVDALIGYDFDLDFLTKKLGVRNQLRKATIRLDEVDDGISCLRNDKTEAFFSHVTMQIKLLQDTGWFDEAFKDYR